MPSTEAPAPHSLPAWIEVRVDVPIGWGELVAEALAIGPCTSVVFGTTSIAAEPPLLPWPSRNVGLAVLSALGALAGTILVAQRLRTN